MSLSVKNLSFSYNQKNEILKNVSFDIYDGEFVAVIGKNGVGKTTLMKCILKLVKIKPDTILINGKDLYKIKNNEKARLISYVPQNISFSDSNVFESILLGRIPYFNFSPRAEDFKIVNKIIDEFSINDIAFKNVNELSGGQRQKVAIARALAQETSLLYLDEPTSNLDIKNQIEVLETLAKIAHEKNKKIIVNIHDINLALNYFDKIIVLNNSTASVLNNDSSGLLDAIKEAFGINVNIANIDNRKLIYIDED